MKPALASLGARTVAPQTPRSPSGVVLASISRSPALHRRNCNRAAAAGPRSMALQQLRPRPQAAPSASGGGNTPRASDDGAALDLSEPPPQGAASLLSRLESGGGVENGISIGAGPSDRVSGDRTRSVAVQRELAKAMQQQKWPAVAPNVITHEGGMDVPAMGGNVFSEARVRGQWLLGLLCLQSLSSVVLSAPGNRQLINDHIVITLFLTMLVGAGGNAGNQSSILVIRGLATGQFQASWPSFRSAVAQQGMVAGLLGGAMAVGGFLRVYLTNEDAWEAAAIALSLFLIVVSSVVTGTALPFVLAWAKVDPAHAGTTIQVVMDVGGVALTCLVSHVVLAHYASVDAVAATAAAAVA